MKLKWSLSLFALCVVSTSIIAAETWSCEYKGNWKDSKNKSGAFTWKAVWREKNSEEGTWSLQGTYSEKKGKSLISGECDNSACDLVESYTDTDGKVKTYEWKGEYKDDHKSDTTVVSHFTGTYLSNSNESDKGTWTATAICTPAG